uniref:Uncharacterized protein n=1 Tax=Terrapene triunguis TaxID=2587831 RepID=A0A674IJT4_9SAUR
IIQSSQPSSLKLTCRAFLLHRVFAFLPCPLPPARAAIVVLRLLLGLEGASWPGSGGSKNGGFSFLLLCEKATRRALSWGWGWGLLNRKHSHWPEPGFSRQSLMASHTSNTSQRGEPESRMSAARESHSRGGRSALGQAESSRWWRAPSRDRAKLRFAGGFRRIRSSAPTTSSVSGRLETSKRYVWVCVFLPRGSFPALPRSRSPCARVDFFENLLNNLPGFPGAAEPRGSPRQPCLTSGTLAVKRTGAAIPIKSPERKPQSVIRFPFSRFSRI